MAAGLIVFLFDLSVTLIDGSNIAIMSDEWTACVSYKIYFP